MATNDQILSSVPADVAAAAVAAAKPKRVRTGCLTCRERHLKCDEALPDCQNCKKSSRECKRGVRLNFIDTQVKGPRFAPPTEEWNLIFQDESRDIASEYRGGLGRYSTLSDGMEHVTLKEEQQPYDFTSAITDAIMDAPVLAHQQLPSQGFVTTGMDPYQTSLQAMALQSHDHHQRHGSTTSDSTFSSHTLGAMSSFSNGDHSLTSAGETRDLLTDPQELLFMQVFVEEVGIWMDSMDPYKHFSRLLPFDSLHEPMLLNAFLACGSRHLTLVNPAYDDKISSNYYQTSSNLLLRTLQNPYRDNTICATTAVILNVYEIMTERALQRMNHIAGARALIKEVKWNANSNGIGLACFWLNVGMELLSCLHFNWQVAWNPDEWGVDMNFDHDAEPGREEVWTHRIVWIVAKINNFRASMTPRPGDGPRDQVFFQKKVEEWQRWRSWIESWNMRIPKTMRPLGQLPSYRTTSKSLFPEVWLIKRCSIIARLFYHTGICLLAQTNPLAASNPQSMHQMLDWEMNNAREICGIVAHVKDRGVASVALRTLATSCECLTDRAEQDEVLGIFDKIRKETGWRIDFIFDGLRRKWGHSDNQLVQQANHGYSSSGSSLPPPPKLPPGGIVNPQFAKADFNQPEHPYQNYYVPPIQQTIGNSYGHFQ